MDTNERRQARQALAAIVAAPDLGPGALSNPAMLANLLSDYLPGALRETGPLLAAAQADVAGVLADHVARGMAASSAVRITAANLAATPHQRLLTAAAFVVKSRRTLSARAAAAGSAIVVLFHRLAARPRSPAWRMIRATRLRP